MCLEQGNLSRGAAALHARVGSEQGADQEGVGRAAQQPLGPGRLQHRHHRLRACSPTLLVSLCRNSRDLQNEQHFKFEFVSTKFLPSQHQELFSKLAFGINKYVDFDMSKLDITVVSGYATYMALTSNGQGKNSEVAMEALHKKTNGLSIAEWCLKHPT